MPSKRCPYCERNWPPRDTFKECPVCREATTFSTAEPMPDGVAALEKIKGEFGWWLYEHDAI